MAREQLYTSIYPRIIKFTNGNLRRPFLRVGGADFPEEAGCLRLVRALAVETHEGRLEASRYLNMELLKEHNKLKLSLAA
jgi:transposase-like protein